jgi:hypothetical protein
MNTDWPIRLRSGHALNWLCFFVPHRAVYCHKSLSKKTLRQFSPAQIGFVFSNVLWVAASSRRDGDGLGRFHLKDKLALFFAPKTPKTIKITIKLCHY